MGLVKRYLEQIEADYDRGYSIPEKGEKYLCPNHYADDYLNAYILNNGKEGVCSYCGKHSKVLDFSDFVEHIGEKLSTFLVRIDLADLPLERSLIDEEEEIPGLTRRCGYLAPSDVDYYESTEEVMMDFDLESDSEDLNRDLLCCLSFEERIRSNPTSLLMSEELSRMWKDFCEFVETKQRFTFFKSKLFDEEHFRQSDNGLDNILSELGLLVHRIETTLEEGTTLYRCRPAGPGEKVVTFDDITAPPASYAKSNRLSPSGISMFYGSFDKETSINEVGYACTKPFVYLGTFKTKRALRVIDLCSNLHVSFWMPDGWQEACFLMDFHDEISKKINLDDNGEVEYVPTQIFTEYLRYLCKSIDGTNYDGIIYKSSITGGKNIVLFYDQKTSASVLSLTGMIERIDKAS